MKITYSDPPISDGDLGALQARLGTSLPTPYLNFLRRSNGGLPEPAGFNVGDEGFYLSFLYSVGDSDMSIDRCISLLPYSLPKPWLPIGRENSGVLGINCKTGEIGVVLWDWIGEDGIVRPEDIMSVATDFDSFADLLGK